MKILIITCLIILAFELFLLWLFRRKGIKGRVGELFIAFFLKRKLDKEQYHILNDVMLPDQNGGTTQIDHVIFSRFGIFVVETKALNGTICGDVNNSQWVQQKVGRGGTPYSKSFYSPIKQVNTHVYRLANNLRNKGIRTYVNAIVYFSNVETSFCLTGVSEKTPVFNAQNNGANQMLNYIVNREKILTQQECEKIVDVIIKL